MGSGIASLLRRHYPHHTRCTRVGLLAACWTALLAEIADVVSWDVQDARACAAGSTAEPHAPRLITACWFRLAHHSPFIAARSTLNRRGAAVRSLAGYPNPLPPPSRGRAARRQLHRRDHPWGA